MTETAILYCIITVAIAISVALVVHVQNDKRKLIRGLYAQRQYNNRQRGGQKIP